MDVSFLQTAAMVLLGWFGLATVTTVGVAVFLKGAHQREQALPSDELALRAWVRGEPKRRGQQRTKRARPPAA
jgi:hypothetical protein